MSVERRRADVHRSSGGNARRQGRVASATDTKGWSTPILSTAGGIHVLVVRPLYSGILVSLGGGLDLVASLGVD